MLNDKLYAAGYGAYNVRSVIGGFTHEVCEMAKEMAKSSARIFYIIDVENLFHSVKYDAVLPGVLDAANSYIQRRWNDELRMGRNVSLIIPVFFRKVAIFQRLVRKINAAKLRLDGNAYAFNVKVIAYSLDFFNNPTNRNPTTERAAKRRRTELVDLNNLLIKLRF